MQGEDYVVTAKAKGVGPWRVLVRHALPNSLFGLLTIVALNIGTLIGATVIIEQIFAVPGIGHSLLEAINNRDVPVVEGIVLVLAVVVVIATCSPTCSTRCWTRGSGMGAQLPEAEAGGVAATLAVAPTVAEPARGGAAGRATSTSSSPARSSACCSSCASSGRCSGPCPRRRAATSSTPTLPSFSEGHLLGADQVGNDLWSRLLYGGRNSLEIAFAVNVIGLVVGGLLGRLRRLLGLVHRHRDHARPRRADRLPVARPGAGHRPEPRAEQAAHDLRAVLLQRPGLRAPGAGPDAAPARAAVHARRAAGGHARAADPAAPRRAQHPARARHLRRCSASA